MRPSTRSMLKKAASQHASPACSVASSKESKDEQQQVEAMLIPFPVHMIVKIIKEWLKIFWCFQH